MDDTAAELDIWPWQANRFQPVELKALLRGRKRNWNRECRLVAWSTYIISASFGAFPSTSFAQFLEGYPPPGYDPSADE